MGGRGWGGRGLRTLDARGRRLALALAAIAGFVDAVGFLRTSGFFVSFMSGNSTRAAVALASAPARAVLGLALIAAFVAGVTAGILLSRRARRNARSAVLATAAGLVALAAALLAGRGATGGAIALAAAMGLENTVFAREGEVRFGVTYMTGALARLGEAIAGALLGEDPRRALFPLGLWASLVGGALSGAVLDGRLGGLALLGPAAGLAALAVTSLGRGERTGR